MPKRLAACQPQSSRLRGKYRVSASAASGGFPGRQCSGPAEWK